MAILQPILDIAALCHLHGVRHVVLSPGSRSAALTLAFTRHGGFQIHVAIDERSGAFIALGIAQETNTTVVVICTSGSAVYNLSPGVAEAFFQQIPLLILSADRPKEWTNQYDGQTIFQTNIFGGHVKKFTELPADYSHPDNIWAINRVVNECLHATISEPYGPVHINVPIREPFYPKSDEILAPSADIRKIKKVKSEGTLGLEDWIEVIEEWHNADRILIAVGQSNLDNSNWKGLLKLAAEMDIPVVADSISNVGKATNVIRHHDLFLSAINDESLQPDLLVTTGMSFISKDLKNYLRKNPAINHWHISTDDFLTDPLQSVTRLIPVSSKYFFDNLFEKVDYELFVQNSDPENDSNYLIKWLHYDHISQKSLYSYIENLSVLNDLTIVDTFYKYLNGKNEIQIGNSMPIRYVNAIGGGDELVSIRCNRGTSGIDGSLSTAIGAALVSEKPVYMLIGDVSFLYDRNGFLLKPLPDNLKIIVLNNGGGNIFRLIDGPAQLPELSDYFETSHNMTMERTCADGRVVYRAVRELGDLENGIRHITASDSIALLEVFTDPAVNKAVWTGLKKFVRDQISN